jgi:hypothetical protein
VDVAEVAISGECGWGHETANQAVDPLLQERSKFGLNEELPTILIQLIEADQHIPRLAAVRRAQNAGIV